MAEQQEETKAIAPNLRTGSQVMPIVPQSFDDIYRIANAVALAGMNPPGLETKEKITIAVMQGLEVGMTPMMAIQSIAVINNRAVIYGDGAIGLVRASGKLAKFREKIEGDGDDMAAVCIVQRKDEDEIEVRFSVDDAKRAGLWQTQARVTRFNKGGGSYKKDNDSPWYKYPKRMLQMRARSWALRDTFADVLKGLAIREEVEDMIRSEMRDVTPEKNAPPEAPPPPPPEVGPPPPPTDGDKDDGKTIDHDPTERSMEFDVSDWLEHLEANLMAQTGADHVQEIWNEHDVEATLETEGCADWIENAHQIKERALARHATVAAD